jgi:hypothetical protein
MPHTRDTQSSPAAPANYARLTPTCNNNTSVVYMRETCCKTWTPGEPLGPSRIQRGTVEEPSGHTHGIDTHTSDDMEKQKPLKSTGKKTKTPEFIENSFLQVLLGDSFTAHLLRESGIKQHLFPQVLGVGRIPAVANEQMMLLVVIETHVYFIAPRTDANLRSFQNEPPTALARRMKIPSSSNTTKHNILF